MIAGKQSEEVMHGKNRVIYLDALRVLLVFFVVLVHVAETNWRAVPVTSFEWVAFDFYNGIGRFTIPCLFMISGVFFLDNSREYTIKKLYTKNILRMVTAYIFWSACYAVTKNWDALITLDKMALISTLKYIVYGHYHLWFVYAIAALYMIVPFLRKIVTDKKLILYFLILSFVFCNLISLLSLSSPFLAYVSSFFIDRLQIHFVLGYSGYFVLGYYLSITTLTKKMKTVIYSLGIISGILSLSINSLWSMYENTPVNYLYGNFTPNTCFMGIAVFVFFKDRVSKIKWSAFQLKAITLISSLSFGMYLVHDFINILFREIGFSTLLYNAILSVPVNTLLVYFISLAIIYLISKIPVLNKYII